MAIAMFALPASGLNKTFNASFPTTLPAGNNVQIQIPVIVFNTTPGVATINSMQFFSTPDVALVGLAPGSPGTLQSGAPAGSLIIVSFPGIKSQKNLTFTLIANVKVSSCTQESWPMPNANAGNSLN